MYLQADHDKQVSKVCKNSLLFKNDKQCTFEYKGNFWIVRKILRKFRYVFGYNVFRIPIPWNVKLDFYEFMFVCVIV